jgi:hypothetical protein
MPATGIPKFDAIALIEFSVDFKGPTAHVSGKAAYVNTRTGNTHGWTTSTAWSAETIAKLAELRELMEQDIASRDFEGSEVGTNSASSKSFGGLNAHLGTADAPQT